MEEKKPQSQTPPSAHDQDQTSPAESKSSGLKSKLPWIVIAILLVLLGAFGGYFVMNQNKQAQTTTPTPAENEQISNQPQNQTTSAPTPTSIPMKTFTSEKLDSVSFPIFSLKHSSDWTESVDKTEVTWKLILTKNGYTIAIYQAPMGGGGCIYEGTLPDGPYSDKRNTPYVNIKSSIGDLRRNDEGAGSGKESFSFCQKSTSDNSYGSFTNVGVLSYSTPINPDETILKEMDSIVESIKTL